MIDVLGGFKTYATMKATDVVYSIETVNNLIAAGCGDGNLVLFDGDTQECLYGYYYLFVNVKCSLCFVIKISFGAMSKGPVRCL